MEEEQWIYEVVDNTDDCTYYTIAVFLCIDDTWDFLKKKLKSHNKISIYTDSDIERIQARAVKVGADYERVLLCECIRHEEYDRPGWKIVSETLTERAVDFLYPVTSLTNT